MSQTRTARNSVATRAACRCRSVKLGDPVVKNNPAVKNKVVWVYAVTTDLDPVQLYGLTGVGGEPVRTVTDGELSAVVGSVDAAAFGEKPLASLLADPATMETIGRAHNDVVAGVASDAPVVPLRLATIYPDDRTIRALLAERHTELAVLLQSFRGTQEWGVKVHMEPGSDSNTGDGDDPGAAPPSEHDGLPVRGPRWQQAETCAEEIDRALSGIAVATRRHPAPYPPDGWMVLNGVYLLDTERADEFGGVARKLAEEHAGLRAEITGPWPPYSFVDRQEV